MARPRRQEDPSGAGSDAGRSYLLVRRTQVESELDERIGLGEKLLEAEITSSGDLESARSDYYSWNDYNEELLKRRFSTPEIADEYGYIGLAFFGGDSLAEKIDDLRDDLKTKLQRLRSLRGRLGLIEESASARRQEAPLEQVRAVKGRPPESIFIVHGHDGEAKLAVHDFVRQVTKLPAVILHDEPNRGRTLVEKFEEVGSASGFAIAILTADDEGRAQGTTELLPRGCQNVVFEFGFFVGFLGRAHTAFGVPLEPQDRGRIRSPT